MTRGRRGGNWVQRDEPLEDKLVRVLGYQFKRATSDPVLMEWASVIRGMVEADASEVQVAAWVAKLTTPDGMRSAEPRLLAVALWHIAKCGLVRDAADRRVTELMRDKPPRESMGEFLARAVANAPDRIQYQPPPGTPKPRRRP
ncbi:MAG: hypothetical protein U0133_22335 [Gemmatimonadales bacterium]